MSKLQRDVKGRFDPLDAQSITLAPHLKADGSLLRIDATVNFRVLSPAGVELETFEGFAQDITLDVASWYTAQFRADAWTAYKLKKGYTEIP